MPEPGLRERKKRATRRRISDIATALFMTRGFDRVSVQEIAEAADVSKMTLFAYFPRKEDLFLDRQLDFVEDITGAISDRTHGSIPDAVENYLLDLLATAHPLSGARSGIRPFLQIIQDSPTLKRRRLEHGQELRDTLEQCIADEVGPGADASITAALLSAAIDAVYREATSRILRGDSAATVQRDQVGFIHRAFDLLRSGVPS